LTTATYGLIILAMTTDLTYVKAQLDRLGHSGWHEVSKGAKVPMRTIKRIGYRETPSPRSDTVGKLAMYFRTKEKRRSA
jgi:hypothetical protein